MEIIILLVPLGFVLLCLAIGAFIWAMRKGQFDDLESPAWRVVFDDQDAIRSPKAGNGGRSTTDMPAEIPSARGNGHSLPVTKP